MKRFIVPIAAGVLAAGSAFAQTTTTTSTTTFAPEHGPILREYSTTQRYNTYRDPNVEVRIGTVLPNVIELHPLPSTIQVQTPERYSYSIVNDRPVVVERTTRRVIHTYE